MADPESLFVGLRQSCRRISIRHVFPLCKCGRHFHLEISVDVSAASSRSFNRTSFYAGGRRVFARARPTTFDSIIHLRRTRRVAKRLDHLLGRDRLVRRPWRIHVAAVGVVGNRTRVGSATNEMAIPLAGAIRVPARHRWFSIYSFDVVALDWLAVDQIASPNAKCLLDFADALRRSARFWLSAPAWLAILDLVQGSARELQSPKAHWQWLVPPAALPGLILPSWTVNWTDFSSKHLPHTATELACGLVAPAALIAGFIWRGRMLIARLKWELILLLVVLLLSMLPTAGLFRWSFRWLPFFHLVLAICAAEILHIRPGSPIPATAALGLTVLTAIAILILHTAGSYAFPLTWIFLGLAAIWICLELLLRDSDFQKWVPVVITFCALSHVSLPPDKLRSAEIQFLSKTA